MHLTQWETSGPSHITPSCLLRSTTGHTVQKSAAVKTGGQPELLEDRQDARREALEVHGVDEIRADLPQVFPRLLGHTVVAVVQLVGAGQALLGAAYPADGDALELVVLRLAGQEVAVGDGALGGEDERLVPAGLQLSRQAERNDLHAGAALGEELVGGEEDSQWRRECVRVHDDGLYGNVGAVRIEGGSRTAPTGVEGGRVIRGYIVVVGGRQF